MSLKNQKEVLIAWINGAEMQVNITGKWFDCGKFGETSSVNIDHDYEYRLKPQNRTCYFAIGEGEKYLNVSGVFDSIDYVPKEFNDRFGSLWNTVAKVKIVASSNGKEIYSVELVND